MMKSALLASVFAFTAVSGVAVAANDVSVTSERPFSGTYSMKVTYDGSNSAAFVQDNSPTDETSHSIDILVYADETGGFTMADNDKHQVFKARDPNTGTTVWRAHIRKIIQNDPISEYRLVMWCSHDGSAASNFIGEVYLIPDRWQEFHMEWQAESSPGARDGVCRLWKAANLAGARERTDLGGTSGFVVNTQLLGAFDFAINAATAGPVYYDDFASFRTLQGE